MSTHIERDLIGHHLAELFLFHHSYDESFFFVLPLIPPDIRKQKRFCDPRKTAFVSLNQQLIADASSKSIIVLCL